MKNLNSKVEVLDFATIYNGNFKLVYNYINSKIHKSEISEELTQDVFLKVNEHLNSFDSNKAKLSTWLITIAKNKIIDYYRANSNNTVKQISDFQDESGKEYFQIADNSTIETYTEGLEINTAINKAMDKLKPNYKRIAELYFIMDKQYTEIAEICEIPLGTVKGMISRVREMLQADLKPVYENQF